MAAWLDNLVNLGSGQAVSPNMAYSSNYPLYEQATPSYPYPNPYNLAVQGLRRNELIYECVHKWEIAFAQAPLRCYQESKDTSAKPRKRKPLVEIPDTAAYKLLANPNPYFSRETFERAKQTYLKVAGFSAWEIELSNIGEPVALWPMRPDWCSFKRGPNMPLQYVRYQPYGLPYADIPIERVLLFQYFDPIFPLLKALSPSAVANRVTSTDNAITDFLQLFFQQGAVINGIMTVDQTLDDAAASRLKTLWRQQHGGVQNWTDVTVLGQGAKYQDITKDFRSMQFDAIDAREERRICQCFHIDPILVATGDAAASSTYNNKEQAHKGWHREELIPEWKWDAGETARQLGRYYPELLDGSVILKHDTTDIYALQDDMSVKRRDMVDLVKAGIYYRDLALESLGEDPVDNGDYVWLNATIRAMDTGGITEGGLEGLDTTGTQTGRPITNGRTTASSVETNALDTAKAAELARFKSFAKRRRDDPDKVRGFKFKYLTVVEQGRAIKEALRDDSGSPFLKSIAYGSESHKDKMRRFEKRAAGHEAKIKAAAKQLFERQKASVLLKLQSEQKDAPDPFDLEEWKAEFEDVLTPLILAAIKDAGAAGLREIGSDVQFSVSDPNITRYLKERKKQIDIINEDTYAQLKDAFAEALHKGESLKDMMDRVETIMGDKIQSSSETIARTETHGALGAGTHASWDQSGLELERTWLSTLDDRTRDAHREAHGQTIGMDDYYDVGGEKLKYPGDPDGSPENIINCRCAETARPIV